MRSSKLIKPPYKWDDNKTEEAVFLSYKKNFFFCFSIWVFFHEHSRFTAAGLEPGTFGFRAQVANQKWNIKSVQLEIKKNKQNSQFIFYYRQIFNPFSATHPPKPIRYSLVSRICWNEYWDLVMLNMGIILNLLSFCVWCYWFTIVKWKSIVTQAFVEILGTVIKAKENFMLTHIFFVAWERLWWICTFSALILQALSRLN